MEDLPVGAAGQWGGWVKHFVSYYCVSKSTKLSDFRWFQRYLLFGTKEWTKWCLSEHGLIAFLHAYVFAVGFPNLKVTQNHCACFTQLRAIWTERVSRPRWTIGLFHWTTDEGNQLKDVRCLQCLSFVIISRLRWQINLGKGFSTVGKPNKRDDFS